MQVISHTSRQKLNLEPTSSDTKFMKLLILMTLLFSTTAIAFECDRSNHFDVQTIGKISIQTYYQDGECNFKVSSVTNGVSQQYFISDHGKLSSFVSSNQSFPTTKNSRSTGTRYFYLRPRTQRKISYETNEATGNISITMANGEKFIISSTSGEIQNITGTSWRKDPKALRQFYRNGSQIGEYAHSEECMNCVAIDRSLQGSQERFVAGGVIIDSVDHGVMLETPFRRGNDPRGATNSKTTFSDADGTECEISNQHVYRYKYEGNAIDGIQFKFTNDIDQFPTRSGTLNENLPTFLDRVCKQYGVEGFDVSSLRVDDGCVHCGTAGQNNPSNEFIEAFGDLSETP